MFKLYFKRKTFKATFNYNGGTLNGETKKEVNYKFGETLTDIAHPTKADPTGNKTYTFLGWLNPQTNQLVDFTHNNLVEENIHLVAKWQETNNLKKIYLNLVYEGLATNQDTLHELELPNQRKIGTQVSNADQEIKDIISAFLSSHPHPNHETDFDQTKSISSLTVENNTDKQIIKLYYKAKRYRVTFNLTEAGLDQNTIDPILKQPLTLKYTNKISTEVLAKLRAVRKTNTATHDYMFEKLLVQETNTEFDPNIAYNSNITLKPVFKEVKTTANITYTIKTQKVDGSYTENTEIKSGKIGSNHTVAYSNPNNTVYQEPEYSVANLTVNADANQNKVTVTLNRKVYDVTFEVKSHTSSIAKRTFRHGAKIGQIDESQFEADGLGILKAELDGTEKTKQEIENFLVQKNHKVTLHIGKPTKKFGTYPQTKVDNPVGIQKLKDETRELKFNSKGRDYTMQFTRSYWKDSAGNKYEKYNNQYFKIEPVDFIKIPKQNTWFTEKIIDFSPFNIYYLGYTDNAKPERSIFKGMVLDIGKVLGDEVHMPTYDTGDFQVKPALDSSLHSRLKKEPTDYAKAILNRYSNVSDEYRDVNLSVFAEYGPTMPYYDGSYSQYWWLGTQYPDSDPNDPNPDPSAPEPGPHAHVIYSDGNSDWNNVNNVLGVVVCIR